jgi:hypothetical protein
MKLAKVAIAASALFGMSLCQAATGSPRLPGAIPYTASTAPDMVSSDVLAHAVTKFDAGRKAGENPNAAIHRNFAQVIEQNFARLDVNGARRVIDNLQDRELADMAKLYKAAAADNHHERRLLHILAHRLDAHRLARLSNAFGYLPVYQAVATEAPALAATFSSAVAFATPEPDLAMGLSGGAVAMSGVSGIGKYLFYTPYEIYMDFRTMPVGSLGAGGALFETALVVGGAAWMAYQAGSVVGYQLVDPLIQTYDPQLWDAIGGTVNEVIERWTFATEGTSSVEQRSSQADMGNKFADPRGGSTDFQVSRFEYFNGDEDISREWTQYTADGGRIGSGGCVYVGHCTHDGSGDGD